MARSHDGWHDHFYVHAPVGTFRANPLGLHDVIGNVAEWCLDASFHGSYEQPVAAGDGLRRVQTDLDETILDRVIRGGSWGMQAIDARSASRVGTSPGLRQYFLGLRPARPLD